MPFVPQELYDRLQANNHPALHRLTPVPNHSILVVTQPPTPSPTIYYAWLDNVSESAIVCATAQYMFSQPTTCPVIGLVLILQPTNQLVLGTVIQHISGNGVANPNNSPQQQMAPMPTAVPLAINDNNGFTVPTHNSPQLDMTPVSSSSTPPAVACDNSGLILPYHNSMQEDMPFVNTTPLMAVHNAPQEFLPSLPSSSTTPFVEGNDNGGIVGTPTTMDASSHELSFMDLLYESQPSSPLFFAPQEPFHGENVCQTLPFCLLAQSNITKSPLQV